MADGSIYILKNPYDPNDISLINLNGVINYLVDNMFNMFEIVTELPSIEDVELGKIYCIKDSTSTDNQNVYVEYALVKDTEGNYNFEKLG